MPASHQQASDSDRSWSQIVQGSEDENYLKEMDTFKDSQGYNDGTLATFASSAGYRSRYRIPYHHCLPPRTV